MSLQYGNFTPLVDVKQQNEERLRDMHNYQVRQTLIKKFVQEHGLTSLHSDYLDMDSYYYDPKSRVMYKVCTVCVGDVVPTFEVCHDQHILEINNLHV